MLYKKLDEGNLEPKVRHTTNPLSPRHKDDSHLSQADL
jgi:hypothetical protein